MTLAADLSYTIGQYTALIALAALFIGLTRRLLTRPAAPDSLAFVHRPLPVAAVPPGSKPPPGWQPLAAVVPAAPVVLPPPRTGVDRRRVTDAIALAVVGVLLVVGVARAVGGRDDDGPWSTDQGRTMRAEFLDGCNSNAARVVDCRCMFDRLTSTPPFDRPAGFVDAFPSFLAGVRSGDPGQFPPAYVSAIRSCVRAPAS